jgi:hypothetical protein
MGSILILTDTVNRHLEIECSGRGSPRWIAIPVGVQTRHLHSIRRRLLQIGLCMECLATDMEFAQDSNQVSYNGIYGGWKAVSQIAIEAKYPIVS